MTAGPPEEADEGREELVSWNRSRRLISGTAVLLLFTGTALIVVGGLLLGTCQHVTSAGNGGSYCDAYGSPTYGNIAVEVGALLVVIGALLIAYEVGARRGRSSISRAGSSRPL